MMQALHNILAFPQRVVADLVADHRKFLGAVRSQTIEAHFVGGPLSGSRFPIPRDAKTWVHPTRHNGDFTYRRKRAMSLAYCYMVHDPETAP